MYLQGPAVIEAHFHAGEEFPSTATPSSALRTRYLPDLGPLSSALQIFSESQTTTLRRTQHFAEHNTSQTKSPTQTPCRDALDSRILRDRLSRPCLHMPAFQSYLDQLKVLPLLGQSRDVHHEAGRPGAILLCILAVKIRVPHAPVLRSIAFLPVRFELFLSTLL